MGGRIRRGGASGASGTFPSPGPDPKPATLSEPTHELTPKLEFSATHPSPSIRVATPPNKAGGPIRMRAESEAAERLVDRETAILDEARTELRRDLDRLPVSRALQRFTHTIDHMLERFAVFIESELGPPPTDVATGRPIAYQLFAAGSYARSALSPFSDVDYGLLIQTDTAEARSYFHRFTERLGALLGDTDPSGGLHPCDLISPTGAARDALIDTPNKMGQRAALLEAFGPEVSTKTAEYVSSALNATRPVFSRHGGDRLHEELVHRREEALGPPAPKLDPKQPRAKLVELLLRSLRAPFGVPKQVPGTFGAFSGQSPEAALEAGRVNIKHDLFKALYFPIITLATLYGVQAVGIPEILERLETDGHIPAVLSRRLAEIYEALVMWRAQNHAAHGKSEEILNPLEARHVRAIRRMVPVLFRLEQSLSRLDKANPNAFTIGAEP